MKRNSHSRAGRYWARLAVAIIFVYPSLMALKTICIYAMYPGEYAGGTWKSSVAIEFAAFGVPTLLVLPIVLWLSRRTDDRAGSAVLAIIFLVPISLIAILGTINPIYIGMQAIVQALFALCLPPPPVRNGGASEDFAAELRKLRDQERPSREL